MLILPHLRRIIRASEESQSRRSRSNGPRTSRRAMNRTISTSFPRKARTAGNSFDQWPAQRGQQNDSAGGQPYLEHAARANRTSIWMRSSSVPPPCDIWVVQFACPVGLKNMKKKGKRGKNTERTKRDNTILLAA